MAHISDVIEGEPKLFRKHFRTLFDMVKIILQKDVTSGLKEGALEALVMFCEKSPKLITRKPEIIKEIYETIFSFMVISTEEVTNEWLSPPEGNLISKN